MLSALGQSSWIDSQFEWEEQPCALCVILHFDCKKKSADKEFWFIFYLPWIKIFTLDDNEEVNLTTSQPSFVKLKHTKHYAVY